MTEEERNYWDAALAQLNAKLDTVEDRLMGCINGNHERLLEATKAAGKDLLNTKTFLIEDALVLGRRLTNVEDRLDKLEKP